MFKISRKDTSVPCYECPDRYVGCHAKCERYKMFDRMRNDKREAALKGLEVQDYIRERRDRALKEQRKKMRR